MLRAQPGSGEVGTKSGTKFVIGTRATRVYDREVRSPTEDVAVILAAGIWRDKRDPTLNAVTLLLLHAKGRHQPRVNLHRLATAVEQGDESKVEKFYGRLVNEIDRTLPKYPEIAETIQMMSEMSDEDFAAVDRLMDETDAHRPS
jgi:hypothetical protein